MRKKLVAGNWKMHLTLPEALDLAKNIVQSLPALEKTEVMIAPSFPFLQPVAEIIEGSPVQLAAQNAHWADSGAFTGEVSVPMLQSVGAGTVILGHSERRQYFGENGPVLKKKLTNATAHDMQVIYCVGENESQRNDGRHFETVQTQLAEVLDDLPAEKWSLITIAYEPVWAIGTGKTATPEQAQEMHTFIRQYIGRIAGTDVAGKIRILYGGSVKPGNAADIFAQPDVDGGLIGGASLKADSFISIIQAAENQR